MKCTNCGKNNASCHVRFTINGETTEQHLCPECAAKLRPEREFAARANGLFEEFAGENRGLLDGFFGGAPRLADDGFFGGGLFDRGPFGDGLFGDGFFGGSFLRPLMGFFPAVMIPAVETGPRRQAEKPAERAGDREVDPELSRQRELNALREQMRAAAESEDYEKAAELRDRLRKMEKSE